ncbi:MAG: acetoacetyl-CoA synthetase, partial [Thermoleophilaceae bacterium]|nr:acetoacetyl-CoA synthetase [Thermoleophilaceae bacterium]
MTPEPGELLWSPSPERVERATLTRFARDHELPEDYAELWRWSVDNLDDFWAKVWDYFEVEAEQPYERVLGDREMPGAEWFPGARLSYAQHVFRDKDPDALALQHASELRELGSWTWGELREQTERIAAGLRRLGVEEGDRVVAYMPNIPETLAAFLATASIGAIWSSCSPDFGARSVIDRFAQIEPKVLLAVDGYRYGGKDFDRCAVIKGCLEEMPSVEHTVVLQYLGCGSIDGSQDWDELTSERADL